jgi:hypothetical protein
MAIIPLAYTSLWAYRVPNAVHCLNTRPTAPQMASLCTLSNQSIMEIINKAHKDIASRKDTVAMTVCVTSTRFSFSGGVAEEARMIIGRYVHFILQDNVCWAFIVNDNPLGFKLFTPNKKKQVLSMYIHSVNLCKKFRKQFRLEDNAKYYVQKTGSEFERQPLFEILTHKPICKVGTY